MNTCRAQCDSCDAVMINGVYCHEHGCPDGWRDQPEECFWCGTEFKPQVQFQRCCSESCHQAAVC